jgi:DNA helicase-2/ATP-dependent DNA helicase PcrA
LTKDALKAATDQKAQLTHAREAADFLAAQFDGRDPSFRDVAKAILTTGLFTVPEAVTTVVLKDKLDAVPADVEAEAADPLPEYAAAVEEFLDVPFAQIEPYASYVSGGSAFDTHQGVKGLEYPRVMVVIDDVETRGFMFKYDKLFSAGVDGANDSGDAESTVGRTRRLFYVTCSRAKESLALVGYSADPRALAAQLVSTGWFERGEVIEDLGQK